jgi:hypothetical protein
MAVRPRAVHDQNPTRICRIVRALDTTFAQNVERKDRRLKMPVLAIGGAASIGAGAGITMRGVADEVHTAVIPDCGH